MPVLLHKFVGSWASAGPMLAYVGHVLGLLGLCWAYGASMLGLCWAYVASMLGLCWAGRRGRNGISRHLALCMWLCSASAEPMLAYVGHIVRLCWTYVGPIGATLGLCFLSVGPLLALCWAGRCGRSGMSKHPAPCWGHVGPMLALCWASVWPVNGDVLINVLLLSRHRSAYPEIQPRQC